MAGCLRAGLRPLPPAVPDPEEPRLTGYTPPKVAVDELLGFFDYDASAPLRLSIVGLEPRDGVEVAELRFDDGMGRDVQAYLVGRPGPRGIVIAHGGTAPGKHGFLGEAAELAQRGFVVLLADTSFPAEGTTQERVAATRARVLTQRRSLDVLEQERGVTRFGFFGHSSGGAQGAYLSAVDSRLDAIVVAAARGGSVRWALDQGVTHPDDLDAFHRLDVEPYVAMPGRRRLLFQQGLRDEVVAPAEARRLYEAAAEPKAWEAFDCGHAVDGDAGARAARLAFFERTLGLS